MTLDRIKEALCSIIAIPVTPFSANGRIDADAYCRLVRRLIDGGITVLTPNGNTSEFYSLSQDECRTAIQATIEGAAGHALVLPGVGYDVATAIQMSQFAGQAGAEAVMVHQPVHPHRSARGWGAYHRAIAEAVPGLAVVPYVRDASVTGKMLRDLVEVCPNVVGVKYAVVDVLQFASTVEDAGANLLTWICGIAESWAPFFWVGGARGFTSGLVNVDTHRSLQMLDSLRSGDYASAMEAWSILKPFEDLRARYQNANNVPAVKEAMAQLGLCHRTVRPPISELSETERREVSTILSAWKAHKSAQK